MSTPESCFHALGLSLPRQHFHLWCSSSLFRFPLSFQAFLSTHLGWGEAVDGARPDEAAAAANFEAAQARNPHAGHAGGFGPGLVTITSKSSTVTWQQQARPYTIFLAPDHPAHCTCCLPAARGPCTQSMRPQGTFASCCS